MSSLANSSTDCHRAFQDHLKKRVQKQFGKILQNAPSVIGIELHLTAKEQLYVALTMIVYRNFGNVLLIWHENLAYVFPHIADDCIDIFKHHDHAKLNKKKVDSGLLSEEIVTLFRHKDKFEIAVMTDCFDIDINQLLWNIYSECSDRTVYVTYDANTKDFKDSNRPPVCNKAKHVGRDGDSDMDDLDLEVDGRQNDPTSSIVANMSATSWPGAEARSECVVVSPLLRGEHDKSAVQNTDDRPDGSAAFIHGVTYDHAANPGMAISLLNRNHISLESQPDCGTQFRRTAQPKHEHYQDEDTRRASFVNWSTSKKQDPASLARMGFYFSGPHDTVVCFYCGIRIRGWLPEDDPAVEHVRHSPDCCFMARQLGHERHRKIQEKITGRKVDVSHVENTASASASNAAREEGSNSRRHARSTPSFYPRNPMFDTYEKRLRSFDKWSVARRTEPLAEAGLYYTGTADVVRCFACGGGLRQWDSVDNPWVEHARWFPECPFLLQEKGKQFVQEVLSSVPDNTIQAQRNDIPMSEQSGTYSEQALADLTLEECNDTNEVPETIDVSSLTAMGFTTENVSIAIRKVKQRNTPPFRTEDVVEVLLSNEKETNTRSLSVGRNIRKPDPTVLRGENQRLKDMLTCSVCKAKERNTLFLPCSHHKMCTECAASAKQCNECGRYIQQRIRTYMG